jgi:hypothetical protein
VNKYLPNVVWCGIKVCVAACRHCDHATHTRARARTHTNGVYHTHTQRVVPHAHAHTHIHTHTQRVCTGPCIGWAWTDACVLLIDTPSISGCCDILLFSWLIAYTHTVPWQDFVDVCDIQQIETQRCTPLLFASLFHMPATYLK